MRFGLLVFLAFFNISILLVKSYDVNDFDAIRRAAVKNIVALENILDQQDGPRGYRRFSKARRIGGTIVLG